MENSKQLNQPQQYLLEKEKKKTETPEQKFERIMKDVFNRTDKKYFRKNFS